MPSTDPKDRKLKYCTNCESSLNLDESFCPACGQKNLDRKVSFWVFVKDFFYEEFNLNNRLFISLKNLCLKPGSLTVAFMEGKRRTYLRPVQLFLLSGFLCFFALSFPIEEQISNIGESQGDIIQTDIFGSLEADSTESNVFLQYVRAHILEANENPKNFIANTLQKLPLVLLVILPVFALFQKLIYIRHKIFFVEHLVFSLHVHAFMFLLIFVGGILMVFFSPAILFFIPLIMFLYLYLAFRRVYEQRRLKTLTKYALLFWIYITTVPILWILLGMVAGLIS